MYDLFKVKNWNVDRVYLGAETKQAAQEQPLAQGIRMNAEVIPGLQIYYPVVLNCK